MRAAFGALPWHKEIFGYLQKVRMNRYKSKSLSFALGSLVVAMGLGSANPTFADANTDLSKAKMAITQHDYRTASLLLKQVFLDSLDGSEEDEQALKLSDEIYAKTNGRAIPVDYELPPELQGLKIRFIRRFQRPDDHPGGPSGGHRVSIAIEAPYDLRSRIGDLALFKEPSGKMLIDSSDARQWGGDVESDRSYIGNDFADHQDMDGLYRLGIDIYKPTHQQFSAWFIVTRAKAWGEPVISSPGNIPRVTPTDEAPRNFKEVLFQFNNFVSSSYLPFESRNLMAYLNLHFGGGDNPNISPYWKANVPNPNITQLVPGRDDWPTKLDSGEYRFAVDFQELRPFGPLQLSREAETIVRFFVK